MSNEDIMNELLKNANFKDISFNNNKLTYQGKTINISNILLSDFFENKYSPLLQNQQYLSSEDLYNILDLNSKECDIDYQHISMKNLNKIALKALDDNNDNNNIISPKTYIEYIKKSDDQRAIKIKEFETQISQCLKYNDYLLNDKKVFLNEYNDIINNIIYDNNNNPLDKLEVEQQYAISKYNEITKDATNFIMQKQKEIDKIKKLKLTKNQVSNVSLGYANAFIVILSTLAAGIITALTIYLSIK